MSDARKGLKGKGMAKNKATGQVAPIRPGQIEQTEPIETLPDYLRKNLDLVFIGLNPGLYSAQIGHYFARKQNRFWTSLSASGLVPEPVGPGDETRLLDWGIGLTDVAKRPTRGIHELGSDEFLAGAQKLRKKILRYKPRVVCFNGFTGYRMCCETKDGRAGLQSERFGGAPVFVLPSTSPRNAHYSLQDIIVAMQDLKQYRDELAKTDKPKLQH